MDASFVRKGLDQLAAITQGFKAANHLFSILQKLQPPTFRDAREALHRLVKDDIQRVLVFFDDIDDYAFEYGPKNKAFLDALVITAMTC